MPRYAFRCNHCNRSLTLFFTYADYETAQPVCPHCQSTEVERRITRVALAKSGSVDGDGLADEDLLSGLDGDDPRSMGRFMRQMSSEMGEDLGDEFSEVVDRLEKGQTPDQIESAMPEIADSPAASTDD